MKKIFFAGVLLCAGLIAVPSVFAHAVVKPNQVGVAAYQTFTLGVPNEQTTATVGLRLLIPTGLESVTPNVKPGWRIDVKKEGEGESAKITEISWTAGAIPVGQRDEFMFSVKVPATETALNWKIYQTYGDGTVVAWDHEPSSNMTDEEREKMEKDHIGPYSVTNVVNDVKPVDLSAQSNAPPKDSKTMAISVAALALSAVALGLQFKSKK